MGVKGLWSILEPVGETCPLSELAGRSVAVDLSGWVVEAESAQSLANAVSRPYLRNLVYRTSALLLQHTLPVFVLDGAAPQLKLAEMARRQGRPETSAGRQQLRGRLRRCARLLDALGVPHLSSDGEAEALCARLDAEGRVDGVVSDDVDAALYGARTLYRHLTAGSTGGHKVTRYSLRRVREELQLNTQQLRELALLLGCDFLPAGLPGLGPQVAQQLVRRLDGRPLLQQLASWLREPPLSQMRAVGELGRMPSHCVSCGHPGTETRHRRDQCPLCGSGAGCIAAQESPAVAACPCDWHRQRRDAEQHAPELKTRDCARRTPDFEAGAAAAAAELTRAAPLPDGDLRWRRPDLARFTAEAAEELGWSPDQCWKFAAPLLARWQLRHGSPGAAEPLKPVQVIRTSVHHRVDCYLVRWQLEDSEQSEITTNEPRPLVEAAHRTLVDAFLETKKKPKKARQPRKAKAASDAGPKAKMGSPSRLITDFFPTRKKAAQLAVSDTSMAAAKAGPEKNGPPRAAAVASGQTAQNADPKATSRARVAGTARHEVSFESSGDSPDSRRGPDAGSAGEAGDTRSPGDSESESESYEELDSDGSVADLSAIIDAITRTHIADDAVIVISDDDDDVLEVSAGDLNGGRDRVSGESRTSERAVKRSVRSGQEAYSHSKSNGRTARSLSETRGKVLPDVSDSYKTNTRHDSAVGTRLPVRVPAADEFEGAAASRGCHGDGRDSPFPGDESASAPSAGAVSDSDSDEYVPLCRRLALKL